MYEPNQHNRTSGNSRRRGKTANTAIQIVGFLVSFVIAATVVRSGRKVYRDWMKSPFEKRLDYHLASSGVKDELDRLAKATPSNEAAEKFGMELAAKGLPRLDDATLLMRARVLSLVLAKLDDKTCASMARGTLNVDVLQRLLEAVQSLDPQSLDQWAQGSVAAMAAEIRQTPVQGLTMKQQEMAIDAIVTACGPDGSRVSEISSRIKTASDADASYLIRKLYTTVVTMPEPTRSMALRALVSEPNQNQ